MPQLSNEMIAVFQDVLNHHPEIPPVDLQRLRCTDAVVTESQDGDSPLSDAILDSCFPRADADVEYGHYTSFATLQSLVALGTWRLYWVYKRLHEDEYQSFCHDHGLDGYLATDPATGRPQFVDMCRDLFYTSLTRLPSANENRMWNDFGDQGKGVRLVFRVHPVMNRCHFRWVRYQSPLLQTVVQELMQATNARLGRSLVLMGISRIGAFYLPMGYHEEDEARLLVKRFSVPGLTNDPWAGVENDRGAPVPDHPTQPGQLVLPD